MKKFAFIFILSMLSFSGMAQAKKFIKGFSGGMMLHSGYQFGGDSHDWLPEANAVFNKQPFFAVDPFVGCDVAVGVALRLTVKADWQMAIRKTGINRPMGPRIYFGFIFAH